MVTSVFKNWYTGSPHFSTTISFNNVTELEKIAKLRTDKMRSLQFRFVTSADFTSPLITGYEYVIALPYSKDDLAQ